MNYSALVDQAIQKYDWKPQQIQPLTNICLVTDQEGKIYALKKSKQSKEKLLLLHQLLEGVRKAGFDSLLPWIKSVDDEVIVSTGEVQWYAMPWKTTETDAAPNSTELIRSLGKFHSLAQPLTEPYLGLAVPLSTAKLAHWKERKEELSQFAQQEEREFLSPFEKSLGENHAKISRSFDFSIRGLERFLESDSAKIPRYTICHCRIHPSNIVVDDQQFYWIDFDHAQVDTPIRDLAMFLHRFTQNKGDREELFQLLEAYEQENPLLPLERKLLAVYLAYPERLVKVVNRYIHEPKISHEASYVKQLEQEIRHLEATQALIKDLWTTKGANPSTKRSGVEKRNKGKR